MTLTTKRLTLRAAKQSDLADLFAIYSDPRAMRYWSTAPHESPVRTQENLDRIIAGAPYRFIIEKDGKAIGTAGMNIAEEVGFILHPDYWRQGIVSEAMQAIIPYLFDMTSAKRLWADADPENTASVNCLKGLGFHNTGTAQNTFFINGVWSHSVYLELKRPA
ncbi:GNAT family N-acetyltransferase [bacterium]|nr:GNAT family N-acetyltransferase [bacterium]